MYMGIKYKMLTDFSIFAAVSLILHGNHNFNAQLAWLQLSLGVFCFETEHENLICNIVWFSS